MLMVALVDVAEAALEVGEKLPSRQSATPR